MAERRAGRLYLADLMMAVLVCGLVAALFTSVRTPPNVALTFFLIFIVLMIWSVFQSRRQAPTCEECGRRFIRPKQAVMLISCPHCGRDQVELSRLIHRVKRVFWGLMGLMVLLVVVALVAVAGFSNRLFEMIAMVGVLIAACGLTLTMLVTVGVATYRWFLKRPRERTCKGCGCVIPARPPAGPMICPECRVRHLRPAEAKKEQTKNVGAVLLFCGLLGLVGIFLVPLPTGSGSGVSWWIKAPLLVLASAAVAFTVLVVTLTVVILLRHRQLRSERGAQTVARKCAGQEGEVVKEGPLVIWYSGPDDPVPMVREQMEAARRRFATLTGAADTALPPFRLLVFHDRIAFVRFHRRISASVDFASLDGLHFGLPYHLSTLCTSPVIGRITAPERTVRSLAGFAMLESIWGPRPAGWLQSGLSRATANCDDPGGLARLNRKMVASLAAGTAMSTEIFTFSPRDLLRLMHRSNDPRNWQKQQQFLDQVWSIVEYLGGEEAPRDLRKSLGAFVLDPRSKTNQEDSFQLHFGTSFGPSLDGWRQWVVDRGIGTYDAPPPKIGDGLLHQVLPLIRDRQAKRGDRLLAIREWANLGFALGADALIDLLRDSGDIPREEIVWALAMVSGMALGHDPDRWQAWWNERQSTVDEPVIGGTLAQARTGPPGD